MLSPDMGTSHGQPRDLSACDFFLWGYMKSQVFKAPAPHTVQELKHRIQQEVRRIPVEMLQRVMGDVRKRLTDSLRGMVVI
jgi:hypothetical protein